MKNIINKEITVWFSCGAASAVAAKKTIEIYGAKNKAGFESTLNQIVIEGLTWEIVIEDAVEYDRRKDAWSWK
mgnify:CR=1 FL=1